LNRGGNYAIIAFGTMKKWLLIVRTPFLLLAVVLAFLGTSVAWYDNAFHPAFAVFASLGLLLAHISVNVFNEYFDYKSGVDLRTLRTPFSGGSGALPRGLVTAGQALRLAIGSFLVAALIGIYFVVVLDTGWRLLPLLLVAGLCIVLYTPLILRRRWPEWAPGVGLGILPILGTYFVQIGNYTTTAVIASIPSGILVHNLLLLNEFPDVEADITVERKTLPITLGRTRAGIFYSIMTILVYVWIVGGVIADKMPAFALIALLTLPFAVNAIRGALRPQETGKLAPALANNVLVVLLTQLLLGVGFILAKVFQVG
jgi:1,4-dihydroxy-2-naphthoate octaprenyltransferase